MFITEPSKGQELAWQDLNWTATERIVKQLQARIFRATQEKAFKKLKSLEKLLIRSRAAKLLATRQVSQENRGKQSAGVDGVKVETPEQRLNLAQSLSYKQYQPKPVRRVMIPKSNGQQRPLGIPTIYDRAMQALTKLALEPEWESRFEANSYGFRAGRSAMDAIDALHKTLCQKGASEWILDADIKACFDTLDHQAILAKIKLFKSTFYRWLKVKVVTSEQIISNDKGTPQGGVISPLLANIALDGMERLFGCENQQGQAVLPSRRKGKDKGLQVVRYADDFVVSAPSKEVLQDYVIPKLQAFLKTQGLELNRAKTRIVHITEGFDFLGFTIRRFRNKLLVFPQKEKVFDHLRKLRQYLRSNLHSSPLQVIKDLNPIIRGWSNYYRHVSAKAVFQKLDHLLWQKLWAWAKRRHPDKSATWLKNKYFNQAWLLHAEKAVLLRYSATPITRHVKVRGKASPFNATQKEYWQARKRRRLARETYKQEQLLLLRKQRGKCALCGTILEQRDLIDEHHLQGRSIPNPQALDNRVLTHRWCHHAFHQRNGYHLSTEA